MIKPYMDRKIFHELSSKFSRTNVEYFNKILSKNRFNNYPISLELF